MEKKVVKNFTLTYELDILNKKIKLNGYPEEDLKDFLPKLKASDDVISQMLYKDIVENAITEMRVMAWSGMDIKEWLKDVGVEAQE
ncbi:hypothetical protein SAMN04488510_12132 [Fervidobacterium changbaicum]|uniref:Uncharacterized protein n=2 Tax=Fervidobacterium TaxID=2422 RepID=A0AAI8CM06_FERIS|nr:MULTISPECIES: hypothetical protein [Fervidobacterium]AMW32938.1 hypothetical protein NA23_06470 [Fervidobacterium islandicum]QAV32975.1 hypothetical protein CBS1_03995 [Fervidobacterium changbaicum]SDH60979.1 hypothetical protein SAMN04488510_12132 [Fervidobacterium changbaicum]